MHQVERIGLQASAPRVGDDDLHVPQVPRARELPGHGDVAGVGVHADDAPAGRHRAGEQVEDAARPAAQVGGRLARPQPEPVQQREGLGLQLLRLPS